MLTNNVSYSPEKKPKIANQLKFLSFLEFLVKDKEKAFEILKNEKEFLALEIFVRFDKEIEFYRFEDVLDKILVDVEDFENFLLIQRNVSFEVINTNILQAFNYMNNDFLDILFYQENLIKELWKDEIFKKKNHFFTF